MQLIDAVTLFKTIVQTVFEFPTLKADGLLRHTRLFFRKRNVFTISLCYKHLLFNNSIFAMALTFKKHPPNTRKSLPLTRCLYENT